MRTLLSGVLAAAMVLAGGCGDPRVQTSPLTPEQAQFDALWNATIRTLRSYQFQPDRQDRRAGLITTFPMVGQHWFEFWRRDAATPYDLAEGSIQTIFRTVTVRIVRDEDAADYRPEVTVSVARAERPRRAINSVSEAQGVLASPVYLSGPFLPEYYELTDPRPVWLPDDEHLARRIERDIERRAARGLRRPVTAPLAPQLPLQPAEGAEVAAPAELPLP